MLGPDSCVALRSLQRELFYNESLVLTRVGHCGDSLVPIDKQGTHRIIERLPIVLCA